MLDTVSDRSNVVMFRYTRGCRRCKERGRYSPKWEVHGLREDGGRYVVEGVVQCKYCGQVMEILPQIISVEFNGMICDSCGGERFRSDIERLQQKADGFEFEVFVDCDRCRKQTSFLKRIRRSIRSVKSLKISMAGIEVQFYGKGEMPDHDRQRRTYSWREFSQISEERKLR